MNSRFREIFFLHWKAVRWILLPFVLLAIGCPMFILRVIQSTPVPNGMARATAPMILNYQRGWLGVFPILAFIIGGIVALVAWSWDHQSRHVYALSLPVTRANYALTKMVAGMGIVLIPGVALLLGTMFGLLMTPLPAELHAYPFSFAMRFLLAMLIAYSLIFALAASTVRTTTTIIIGVIVVLVFGSIGVEIVNTATHRHLVTPAEIMIDAFMNWPGPFAVFGGNWAIIDV